MTEIEEPVSFIDEPTEAPAELALGDPAEDEEGDELLLDTVDSVEGPLADEPGTPEPPTGGRRTWLTQEGGADKPAPKSAREGSGTLFERMSNIARGAAKAQVDEAPEAPRMRTGREPLDIPRFLNRQNNQ